MLRSLHKHPPARLNREASPHTSTPKRTRAIQRCRKPPLAPSKHTCHASIILLITMYLLNLSDHAATVHTYSTTPVHACTQIRTLPVSTPVYPRARVTRSRLFLFPHPPPLYMPCQPSIPEHAIQDPGKKPSATSASGDCDQTAAPLVKASTVDLPTWDMRFLTGDNGSNRRSLIL